jgi:2-polyprenyl-3-methyl-5-hydroxy-6-metoxy-1,4-benzoquinol methylase
MARVLERCPLCRAALDSQRQGSAFSKCLSCDVMVRAPLPSDEELAELYQDSWRDPIENTRETGGTNSRLARVYSAKLARALSLRDFTGLKVLDFGAGRGAMLAALSALGADAYGIDPFGAASLERQGFRAYRAVSDLPRSLRFDGIVMIDVIEHLSAPGDILKQLSEVLKDRGWIFIATPNIDGLAARLSGSSYREALKPGHVILFGLDGLKKLLEDSGFVWCRRLTWLVPYSRNPLRRFVHYALQSTGMDGEARYVGFKRERAP